MKALLPAILAMTMTFGAVSGAPASRIKHYNTISQKTAYVSTTGGSENLMPTNPTPPDKGAGNGGFTSSIKTKYINIAYGSLNKDYQLMDIYLPNKGKGPFPVIVFIHGGGFRSNSGSPTTINPTVFKMAISDRYAVVCINYRGSDQAKFPAAVNDCKAAVRFLRAYAAKYNLNPKKIAAWGESAGGNLASMLGTTGNVSTLNGDNYENLYYSSAVQAVVDWFGPIEFLKEDEQFAMSGIIPIAGMTNSDTSNASRYIGQLITNNIKLTESAGPSYYVSKMKPKTAPSFFIEHGKADNTVPVQQSKNFAAKLIKALGWGKVKFQVLNGAGHNTPQFYKKTNLIKIMTFLDDVFKKKYFI